MANSLVICTASSSGSNANIGVIEEVIKKSLIQNIHSLCNKTALGATKSFKDVPRLMGTTITDETIVGNAWLSSLIPDIEHKEGLFKECTKRQYCYNAYTSTIPKIRKYIQGDIPPEVVKRLSGQGYTLEEIASKKSSHLDLKFVSNELVRRAVCSGVTILNNSDCAAGLGKILEYAAPNDSEITGLSSYKEVLSNPKYLKGTQRAALLILDRFEKNKVSGSNLFDDIFQSFKKEGMSSKDADNATWEILAIVASGGPNTSIRLRSFKVSEEQKPLKWALSAIALALPKLDFISAKSGHPYSMPPNITTTCDIGKPYHFWMTAYLARKLTKEGLSPMGSASAAYLAQKGYEVKSTTTGRDPNRVFTQDSFGDWNNVLRVDTAFSSAAAVFGANHAQGKIPRMNIDEGLKKIIMAGSIQPKLSNEEAQKLWNGSGRSAYDRWNKIINSDSGFEYHLKSLVN
ncbi:MAG: hypothetical protein V4596_12920 [Bdellovibrionota bacterium]